MTLVLGSPFPFSPPGTPPIAWGFSGNPLTDTSLGILNSAWLAMKINSHSSLFKSGDLAAHI